jgi:hypothetical protein
MSLEVNLHVFRPLKPENKVCETPRGGTAFNQLFFSAVRLSASIPSGVAVLGH